MKLIPYPVSVPVLSKQTVSIIPPSTNRGGEIQLIFSFFNLDNEKLTPIEKAAASYGGQIIVTRSEKVYNNKAIEDKTDSRGSINV